MININEEIYINCYFRLDVNPREAVCSNCAAPGVYTTEIRQIRPSDIAVADLCQPCLQEAISKKKVYAKDKCYGCGRLYNADDDHICPPYSLE